ncbi:sigma-54-dependent transcriptional regulator [Saccharophagus degradans]|uniref:Sigma-54 dependent transcriptional regulator n=1 Tax=Saccharophagus degradans TaxID=86304 RepID=A0AAW7X6T3_9GAMM|nr:sigma-54 dependent transcriptional regulator [Saccharophagus degradans]MDO6423378.1 sigma-54 dependent transcriptional regulator [Saccharophagus degradans]MDO6606783.1 sigma-54 dependent transcriptional regulator [Saccharophagus degradans]
MTASILIADDDEGIISALSLLLKSEGFTVDSASSPQQVLDKLLHCDYHLVLMDLNYSLDTTSGEEGLQLLTRIRNQEEFLPVVVMTGWATIELAVNTIKSGANDFIQKPWDNNHLLATIRNLLKLFNAQKQTQKLSQHNQLLQNERRISLPITAHSASMKSLLAKLQQVAKSDVNILLTGENGTGKSMLARYVHDYSNRASAPFIAVNMGAITETLFESEMFGHLKGAFTDAKQTRIGRFELAESGTLFLDEIANTPLSQQAKLLRVLEERRFEKVGATKTQVADIRLITATNSQPSQLVADGLFRQDLLYRINTVELVVPPLRERLEDIIPLAQHYLMAVAQKYNQPQRTLSTAAQTALLQYPWPGNVRELGHVIERAHILSEGQILQPSNLGLDNQPNNSATSDSNNATDLRTLEAIELDALEQRFEYFNGDANKAAQSLGLSRSTFYRRLSKAK